MSALDRLDALFGHETQRGLVSDGYGGEYVPEGCPRCGGEARAGGVFCEPCRAWLASETDDDPTVRRRPIPSHLLDPEAHRRVALRRLRGDEPLPPIASYSFGPTSTARWWAPGESTPTATDGVVSVDVEYPTVEEYDEVEDGLPGAICRTRVVPGPPTVSIVVDDPVVPGEFDVDRVEVSTERDGEDPYVVSFDAARLRIVRRGAPDVEGWRATPRALLVERAVAIYRAAVPIDEEDPAASAVGDCPCAECVAERRRCRAAVVEDEAFRPSSPGRVFVGDDESGWSEVGTCAEFSVEFDVEEEGS